MQPVGSEPVYVLGQRDLELTQFIGDFISGIENVSRQELLALPKILEEIFDCGGRILGGVYAMNGIEKWPCIKIPSLPYKDFPSVDEPRTIKKYLSDQLLYYKSTPKSLTEIREDEISALFTRVLRFS